MTAAIRFLFWSQQLHVSLTTATLFMLWHSATLFLLNYYHCFLFLRLTVPGFFCLELLLNLPSWKLSIFSPPSFCSLPFNITGDNLSCLARYTFVFLFSFFPPFCFVFCFQNILSLLYPLERKQISNISPRANYEIIFSKIITLNKISF